MTFLIDGFTVIYFILAVADVGTNALRVAIAVCLIGFIIINDNFIIKNKYCNDALYKCAFFFLVAVSLEILFSGSINFAYVLSKISMFLPITLYIYYKDYNNRKRILGILFLLWLVIAIRAAILYSSGTLAARAMAAHKQEDIGFSGGGYGFAISSAILCVFLIDYLLWNKLKYKVFYILFAVILVYVVVLTQSTITIIALVIGIIASLILRLFNVSSIFNGINKHQLVGILLTVLFCFVIFVSSSSIGQIIVRHASQGSGIVSRRLLELGRVLASGSDGYSNASDISDRMSRIISSISLFLSNPLFGMISRYGTNFYNLQALGVGSHGELFDSLANFGLFAGIPYLGIFYSGLKNTRLHIKETQYGFAYIITFLLVFMFNPCLYMQVNVVLFFMIPMLLNVCLDADIK